MRGLRCFVAIYNERIIFELLQIQVAEFFIKKDTFDLVQQTDWSDGIRQLIVQRENRFSCDQNNSRFACLNECFKEKVRLSRYFFDRNETGLVQLKNNNQTVKDHEEKCFARCERENCKLVYLIAIDRWMADSKIAIFKERPLLSEFDFWLQFIGMVCLFVGISFHQQLCLAIKFICSKMKNTPTRHRLAALLWPILCIGLIFFTFLLTMTILNFKTNVYYPARRETIRNLIEPEQTHLLICLPFVNENQKTTRLFDANYYANRTLQDLENESDCVLRQTIDGIYLSFQNKTVPIQYHVQPKVIFRYSFIGLQRCFHLVVKPAETEPRYQMLLSISKLIIKFKTINYFLFLLTEKEQFNQETFSLTMNGQCAFKKSVTKRSRLSGKCMDYAGAYPLLNCTSRSNCVEQCINRRSMNERQNITMQSFEFNSWIIDRDQFTAEEWTASYLNWNESIFNEIRTECQQAIPMIPPCVETKFIQRPDSRIRSAACM